MGLFFLRKILFFSGALGLGLEPALPKRYVTVCRAIDNWQLLITAEGFWQASSNLLWVRGAWTAFAAKSR